MENNAGLLKAFEVLGAKIIELETDVNYERLVKESLERQNRDILKDNVELRSKVDAVKAFINTAEEQ